MKHKFNVGDRVKCLGHVPDCNSDNCKVAKVEIINFENIVYTVIGDNCWNCKKEDELEMVE